MGFYGYKSTLVTALFIALTFLSAKPAHAAADYVVNSLVMDHALPATTNTKCDVVIGGVKKCTLKEAMTEANNAYGAKTIAFDPALFANGPRTIDLTYDVELPTIFKPMTIQGPGADLLTIDAHLMNHGFRIQPQVGGAVVLSGLRIINTKGLTKPTGADIGGAIDAIDGYGTGNFTLTVDTCVLDNNEGSNGGAITFYGKKLTILNSTISNNRSTDAGGGGLNIYAKSGPAASAEESLIRNTTFFANHATGANTGGHGGAIKVWQNAKLRIANSTISGNTATDGAGIDLFQGQVHLMNVTVAKNEATTQGGGVFVKEGLDPQSLTAVNTLMIDNTAPTGPDCAGVIYSEHANVYKDYNVIANKNGCTIAGAPHPGPVKPKLAALDDNGGPTHTHALLVGNTAIDAGHAETCVGDLATDQRGKARKNACDIGAFEYGHFDTVKDIANFILAVNADAEPVKRSIELNPNAVYTITKPYSTTDGINTTNGLPQITSNIEINGNGAMIQRVGAENFRIFDVKKDVKIGQAGFLTLNDLTIQGGSVIAPEVGGGIRVDLGSAQLNNVRLQNNTATESNGGGIALIGGLGFLDITKSTIMGNTARNGGGVFNEGQTSIEKSTVYDNEAANGLGGAFFTTPGGLTVVGATIYGNQAEDGAAIYITGGKTALLNVTVADNISESEAGDAMGGSGGGELHLKNTVLRGNTPHTMGTKFLTVSQGHNLLDACPKCAWMKTSDAVVNTEAFAFKTFSLGDTPGAGHLAPQWGNSVLKHGDPALCAVNISTYLTQTVSGYAPASLSNHTDQLGTIWLETHGGCSTGAVGFPGQCGDATVQVGPEACDNGPTNSNDTANACRLDCTNPRCGDTVIDSDESCDDGNTQTGDGCRPDCSVETCGDGVVDPKEACDAGAANSNDQPDTCRATCVKPSCGDGVTDTGESCDDGNASNADSCLAGCITAACGDGIVEIGKEACDAGAANSNVTADACRSTCVAASCGDGVVDTNETCDDSNHENGDGCDDTCKKEVIATVTPETTPASKPALPSSDPTPPLNTPDPTPKPNSPSTGSNSGLESAPTPENAAAEESSGGGCSLLQR